MDQRQIRRHFGLHRPILLTREEVPEPQNLSIYIEVNGHVYQNGSIRTMHFGVTAVVSHLSKFMSLQPGDVIATGAPPVLAGGKTLPTT